MTSALLLSLLMPLQEASLETPPVGTHGGFQSLALEVRRSAKADAARAGRLATLLPTRTPTIYWDEKNVPAVSREAFRSARDYAIAEWGRYLTDFKPKIVKSPALAARGLVFTFEPRLAKGAGATHFLAMDSTRPRLETVIGLRRGEAYTGEVDVHNEVLFAIGTYLGVLPTPAFGGAMGRTDVRASVATAPRSNEARTAEMALVYATDLRRAISKREPISTGVPRVWTESKAVDLGTVVQGQAAETSFAVANNGTGPMLLWVAGDCSCLSAVGPTRLEAGESGVVRARYDTSLLGGKIGHKVIVRTTDPESPEILVAMNVAVRTLSRFIVPGGTTQAPEPGAPVDLYFVYDESKPLEVTSARVTGIEGAVTYEPWSGTLADPVLQEGPLARKGYRLRLVPKGLRPGMSLATITLETKGGDKEIGNVFLQRGIAATPPTAAFSDPGTTPGRREVELTHPGKPFRVLSVRAEGRGIAAAVTRPGIRSDRHRIAVTLDPAKLREGDDRRVIVRTDDPSLPEIIIPVLIPEL